MHQHINKVINLFAGQLHFDDVSSQSITLDLQSSSWVTVQKI